MNRFDTYSIKWRLFVYLIIFVAIPVAMLWFFQTVFLEQFYTAIKVNDVESSVDTIAQNIENQDVGALIEQVAHVNDVSVRVYEQNSGQIYAYDFGPESGVPLDEASVRDYFERAQNNGGTLLMLFDKPPAIDGLSGDEFEGEFPPRFKRMGKSIVCARVVDLPDGNKRLILINALVTPVDATVRTLQIQLMYITLIMVALSLFLALLMSRRISKPIIQTTAAAKLLAKGDYGTVFDAHGYLEIAELNKTLNFAASEMSKVERLRHELIANVSHDLRTPLTMITGYAEMMRDIPGENTPENVQIIIDESSRLSLLVSDMLDISRFQSGGQELHKIRFNITASVRGIMQRYSKLTEQDNYDISFEASGDAYVEADSGRIEQVVYNLINNAINYTGEDKKVIVRQTVEDGRVRIEITDTGAGIAAEDIPYIWDRYYRVDKTHKRAAIGSGLGLSIVRSILELHGAEYGVLSNPGEGSTFWFSLPLA